MPTWCSARNCHVALNSTVFFVVLQAFARAGLRAMPRAAVVASTAAVVGVTAVAAAAPTHVSAVPFTGVPGTKHEVSPLRFCVLKFSVSSLLHLLCIPSPVFFELQRSFIAIKPDAVQRGLIAPIINELETKGYKLVAMKFVRPTKSQAEGHYEDLSSKPFFPGLVNFFSSGPIVAMVWEGQGVIKGTRHLLGATNPEAAPAGSIRSRFSVITGRNVSFYWR
jgi:nucleoside-diphosphate kinase